MFARKSGDLYRCMCGELHTLAITASVHCDPAAFNADDPDDAPYIRGED